MIRFDPIVRVLLHVVKRARHELTDNSQQARRPIGHDLNRLAMPAERSREEPSRGTDVSLR
jgi:hypothetical protein